MLSERQGAGHSWPCKVVQPRAGSVLSLTALESRAASPCRERLHTFHFPKLVDEVIGDHSSVTGWSLENRPTALVSADAIALRKLRIRHRRFEQVDLQRLHEQCAQCGAALSRADLCSPVESIGEIDGGLHGTTLPCLWFGSNVAQESDGQYASRPSSGARVEWVKKRLA